VPEPRELTPNASAAHLFGAELRHQRKRRGLSLERLCTVAAEHGYRVGPRYVSNVEAGTRLPQERRFAEVCDVALDAGGMLGRLWDYADADRDRGQAQRAQQRATLLEFAGSSLAPVVSGDVVYVPVIMAAGTIAYVKLTRRAFLAHGAALAGSVGVLTPDDLDRLTLALELPHRADEDVAGYFRQLLGVQKSYDYKVRPTAQLGPAAQQTVILDRLCRDAKKPARAALRAVQSEYAEYVGWLHQELGNGKTATYWTDKAVGWAQAGGDYQLVSYLLGRKTNIAVWAGDHREAVDFAESGRRVPWEVPPGLASVNAQYEARAHALARDESGALRLLDDSRELIESRERSGEDRIYWACRRTPSHLQASAAHSYVNLGRWSEAIDMLAALLPGQQPEPHHVGTLSLLALAHAKAGDPFAAAAVGEKALDLAVSASALIILAETGQELRLWAGETQVLAFRERLRRQRTLVAHQTAGLISRQYEHDQPDG
jgi:transcriptional regulator with XRE-family HTH domain